MSSPRVLISSTADDMSTEVAKHVLRISGILYICSNSRYAKIVHVSVHTLWGTLSICMDIIFAPCQSQQKIQGHAYHYNEYIRGSTICSRVPCENC